MLNVQNPINIQSKASLFIQNGLVKNRAELFSAPRDYATKDNSIYGTKESACGKPVPSNSLKTNDSAELKFPILRRKTSRSSLKHHKTSRSQANTLPLNGLLRSDKDRDGKKHQPVFRIIIDTVSTTHPAPLPLNSKSEILSSNALELLKGIDAQMSEPARIELARKAWVTMKTGS